MRPSITLTRTLTRRISSIHHLPLPRPNICPRLITPVFSYTTRNRQLSTTSSRFLGLSPDSADPEPPKTESSSTLTGAAPADLTDSEYHELADQYLNSLLLALEEKSEAESEGMDVEYSAGVLTINHPKGTYVMNKQPPNKQIWLSSPITGPKRFDYVIAGASQEEKEGSDIEGEGGSWVYIRDGSLLSDILEKELMVTITEAKEEGDVTPGKEGPGGSGA